MPDIWFKISERERREIEEIGKIEAEKIGRVSPVSVEEMAGALLSAHLVLIKDCGGILPGTAPKLKAHGGKGAAKVSGKGGVSLSGGL